jgi:tartrate dehydrogenase/decarboxylase/D-malate dehydrogenase
MRGNPRRVAVIPGDGIGPEVVNAAVELIEAAAGRGGQHIDWQWLPWGSDYHLRNGRMMPADALEQLRAVDAILLGAVGDPRVPDHVTLHGLLLPIRRGFDQYLCLRPVRQYSGVQSRLRGVESVDLIVVRENTEGEYADVGGTLYSGNENEIAVQSNIFTRRGCRRIMEAAFEIASRRRKHVTSVTKSNAQAHGMVLWDDVFREIAEEHPDVATNSMLVDAAAMELVRDPERFDVIVASNLFGDILSDLAAAIAGGLGIAPSGNINPSRAAPSMFEPVHGSAPDIAGRGVANPVAAILAGAMMLEHIGLDETARNVRKAVEQVLDGPGPRTPDLGGTANTGEMTRALISALEH